MFSLYWALIVLVIAVCMVAVVFLRLSRPDGSGTAAMVSNDSQSTLARAYPTPSNTYDSDCQAPLQIRDHRMLVRVDGGKDGRPAIFIIDTAYELNAMTESLHARWPAREMLGEQTIVGSHSLQVQERTWPAGLRIGNCPMPTLQQRTVVVPDSAFPDHIDGVLGVAFLRAPNFINVLLDMPGRTIHFNVDPRAAAPPSCDTDARCVYRTHKKVNGMFTIDATITTPEGQRARGSFVLDTGAPRLVLGRSMGRKYPWLLSGGVAGSLNMSGHISPTRIHRRCCVRVGTQGSSTCEVDVSAVAGASDMDGSSLLQHDGLLGMACLAPYRMLWSNEDGGSLTLLHAR